MDINYKWDYVIDERETCLAIGRHLKFPKIVLLESVKNCSVGHRCFQKRQKDDNQCQLDKPWSGCIACYSRNGWYPAATYNEPMGYCGFSNVVSYSSVQYWKTHIQDAMRQAVFYVNPPLCKGMRCTHGMCIDDSKVCDRIPDCPDGLDEHPDDCAKLRHDCTDEKTCKCNKAELRCSNGKCIDKSMFCDTKDDCNDCSDEPDVCTCGAYLKLANPNKICDGIRNCYDKTDEDPRICTCTNMHYRCKKSSWCVPQDYVCDGIKDCPEGDDESVCYSLNKNSDGLLQEVYVKTAGVWNIGCFSQNLTVLELEDICAALGYKTGSAKITSMSLIPGLTPIIDPFVGIGINGVNRKRVVIAMRSGEEPLVTFKSSQNCYRLFLECLH